MTLSVDPAECLTSSALRWPLVLSQKNGKSVERTKMATNLPKSPHVPTHTRCSVYLRGPTPPGCRNPTRPVLGVPFPWERVHTRIMEDGREKIPRGRALVGVGANRLRIFAGPLRVGSRAQSRLPEHMVTQVPKPSDLDATLPGVRTSAIVARNARTGGQGSTHQLYHR